MTIWIQIYKLPTSSMQRGGLHLPTNAYSIQIYVWSHHIEDKVESVIEGRHV